MDEIILSSDDELSIELEHRSDNVEVLSTNPDINSHRLGQIHKSRRLSSRSLQSNAQVTGDTELGETAHVKSVEDVYKGIEPFPIDSGKRCSREVFELIDMSIDFNSPNASI